MAACSRGKAKAYVLVGDNTDAQTDARIASMCMDSLIRRPSVDPRALQTIFGFVNNLVLSRRKPDHAFSFEAAAFFIFKNQASWVLSGNACAILFSDGDPIRRSAAQPYPSIGTSPAFRVTPEEAFSLPQGENALLLCSGTIWTDAEAAAIGEMLRTSGEPSQWMDSILDAYPNRIESAMAIFLPAPRRAPHSEQK